MALSHIEPLFSAGPASAPRRRLFSCAEVQAMVEAGIVGEDEPFELIDGELLEVTPQGPPHANVIRPLGTRLTRLYATLSVSQGRPSTLARAACLSPISQ